MKIPRTLLAVGLVAALAQSANAQLVTLDFETAGQYSGNFRTLSGGGTGAQSSNGAANDFVQVTSATGGSTGLAAVYDATPANGTVKSTFAVSQASPLTVNFDVQLTTANRSFGIYLINPTTEASAYLALFNVDNSGTTDLLRFASAADPSNNTGFGTLVNGTFANNADVGVAAGSGFFTLSLNYSINLSNQAVLALTAGNTTSTITFAGPALSTVEVGFRASPTPGGFSDVAFDNFSVVPEPSALMLSGLGLAGLALVRRRRVARR